MGRTPPRWCCRATDGDGAIGIKRIKERGGLTIAQDPSEAVHGSMPRSAIATGMVDWVLPANEMPARLIQYQRLERSIHLPPEDGPEPAEAPAPTDDAPEAALREVLRFLRVRTGRDFSYYKRATVLRRIARRMQVNGVTDMQAYVGILRTSAGEAGALLQDLLISVTNFFRDASCFQSLEALIPELFNDKTQIDAVRVWVPACATGEEAYSIAILLAEHARTLEAPPSLQIFATDLDEQSIATARTALYPETIEADVSPERLRALLRQAAPRLPGPPRDPRDGAVRGARPAEGFAVLAPRPGVVPQPADLPDARCAGPGARHLPLRVAARRQAVPRLVGERRREHAAVRGHRQEEPAVQPAAGGAREDADPARPDARCR